MKHLLILPVLLLTLFAANGCTSVHGGPVYSADFRKGLDAYNNGDYETALREFRPLAEQGNAGGQLYLGHMYGFGHGVPKNDKTAVKWLTLAVEQGSVDAQYSLGKMYQHKQDKDSQYIPDNAKTAVKWYTLAAEQGHVAAQLALGEVYAYGQGVPKNYKAAVKWLTLAAKQGGAGASINQSFYAEEAQSRLNELRP